MKKLVAATVVIIATMALVACGAQPQARPGFSKSTDSAVNAASKIPGVDTANSTIYQSPEAYSSTDATNYGMDLSGLLDPNDYQSMTLNYLSATIIVPADTTKTALFVVVVGFDGDSNLYQMNFTSTGSVTNSNGSLIMQASDTYSVLNITGLSSGATDGSIVANVKDASRMAQFATNTQFACVQKAAAAATSPQATTKMTVKK